MPTFESSQTSSATLELRKVAAQRKSRWTSNVLGWLGTILGLFAVAVLVLGARHSLGLPDTVRPNVGPGLTESLTAFVGAAMLGACLSLGAVFLVVLALVHSSHRLRTLGAAMPVAIYVLLLTTVEYWNH